MKRFVVGTDGSEASAAAVRWTGLLAAATGAEVLAVNAFDRPWSELSSTDRERWVEHRKGLLAGAWSSPASEAGAPVRTIMRDGDPRDIVLAVAEDEGAELVVLGRTGEGGGPGFLHLGSVVEYAAHHTRHPLAVIPSTTPEPIKRVIVGIDGSPDSLRAVEWCAELAQAVDATVVAVTAMEPFLEWTPESSPNHWRRRVERQIDKWVKPIDDAGVEVARVVQRDLHPADGLLDAASAHRGDVLVIGARGTGRFSGIRIGGVAMKVLHKASLPLVLIPPTK